MKKEAILRVLAGETQTAVALDYNIDTRKLRRWLKAYREDPTTIEKKASNNYKAQIDEVELKSYLSMDNLPVREKTKLQAIYEISFGTEKQAEVATRYGVTTKAIAGWRKKYINGEIPKLIML